MWISSTVRELPPSPLQCFLLSLLPGCSVSVFFYQALSTSSWEPVIPASLLDFTTTPLPASANVMNFLWRYHVMNRETEHIFTVEYQPTHRLPSATNRGVGTMSPLGVPTPNQPTHRLPSATNCGVGTMSPLGVPTPNQPTHRLPSATNCGVGTMSPSGAKHHTPNQSTNHIVPSRVSA